MSVSKKIFMRLLCLILRRNRTSRQVLASGGLVGFIGDYGAIHSAALRFAFKCPVNVIGILPSGRGRSFQEP